MRIKILEVRDEGTFIPLLCIDMNDPANEAQRYYLWRCGYSMSGFPNIAITRLDANGGAFSNDPYYWASCDGYARTFRIAHHWILDHWYELKDGDVVCVEHIVGERNEPKVSERFSK